MPLLDFLKKSKNPVDLISSLFRPTRTQAEDRQEILQAPTRLENLKMTGRDILDLLKKGTEAVGQGITEVLLPQKLRQKIGLEQTPEEKEALKKFAPQIYQERYPTTRAEKIATGVGKIAGQTLPAIAGEEALLPAVKGIESLPALRKLLTQGATGVYRYGKPTLGTRIAQLLPRAVAGGLSWTALEQLSREPGKGRVGEIAKSLPTYTALGLIPAAAPEAEQLAKKLTTPIAHPIAEKLKPITNFFKDLVGWKSFIPEPMRTKLTLLERRGVLAFEKLKRTPLPQVNKTVEELGKWFDKFPKEQQFSFIVTSQDRPTTTRLKKMYDTLKEGLHPELAHPEVKQSVRQIFDMVYDVIPKELDVHYIKNYFPGMYENPKQVEEWLKNRFPKISASRSFTKEKYFDLLLEAHDAGFRLKEYNPVKLAFREFKNIQDLRFLYDAQKELIKDGSYIVLDEPVKKITSKTGRVLETLLRKEPKATAAFLTARHPKKATEDWIPGDLLDPIFAKYKIEPNVFHILQNFKADYSSNPIKNILYKTSVGTTVFRYSLGAFHLWNTWIKGSIVTNAAVTKGGLLNPIVWLSPITGLIKGTKAMRDFTPEFQEAILAGVGGLSKEGFQPFEKQAFVTLGNIANMFKEDQILQGVLKLPLATALTVPEASRGSQFEKIIPAVKFSAWSNITNRLLEENAERILRGEVTKETLQQVAARAVDRNFGMLNDQLLGRSKELSRWLRVLYLVPGYMEGNFRNLIGAFTKGGRLERAFIVNSLLFDLVTAQVATHLVKGVWKKMPKSVKDWQDLFTVETGQRDNKGKEIVWNTLTYEKDWARPIWQSLANRRVPVLDLMYALFSNQIPTDNFGKPIYNQADSFETKFTKFIQQSGDEVGIPITLSTIKNAIQRGASPSQALFFSELGFQPTYKAATKRLQDTQSKIYDLSSVDNRTKVLHQVYQLTDQGKTEEAQKVLRNYNQQVISLLRDVENEGVKVNWDVAQKQVLIIPKRESFEKWRQKGKDKSAITQELEQEYYGE